MKPGTDLCSLRQLYGLDGLTEIERQEFEAHLEHCAECQAEVAELADVTDMLLYDFDWLEPPTGMRERVLKGVFADPAIGTEASQSSTQSTNEPHRTLKFLEDANPESQYTTASRKTHHATRGARRRMRKWAPTWGAAAAVLICASLVWGLTQLGKPQPTQLQSYLEGATATLTLQSSSSGRSLYMQFSGLTPVRGSKVYQVWLIKSGEAPQSAGVFVPDASGKAVFAALLPAQRYQVVAVTLEPKAIDIQPLGTKVFAGNLSYS